MKKQATILFIALLTFLAPLNTQGTTAFIDIIRPEVKQANLEHQIALAQELIPLSKNKEERKAMEARIAELKQEIFNHKLYSAEKRKKLLRIVGLILASGAVAIPVGIAGYRHFKKPKAAAKNEIAGEEKPTPHLAPISQGNNTPVSPVQPEEDPLQNPNLNPHTPDEPRATSISSHTEEETTPPSVAQVLSLLDLPQFNVRLFGDLPKAGDNTPPPSTPVSKPTTLNTDGLTKTQELLIILSTENEAQKATRIEEFKQKNRESAAAEQQAASQASTTHQVSPVPFAAFSPSQPTH